MGKYASDSKPMKAASKDTIDKRNAAFKAMFEELKQSMFDYEAGTYSRGWFQAEEMIHIRPDYRFLCELNEQRIAFNSYPDPFYRGKIKLDGLDDYPQELRHQLIRGFFEAVLKIITKLQAIAPTDEEVLEWDYKFYNELLQQPSKEIKPCGINSSCHEKRSNFSQ